MKISELPCIIAVLITIAVKYLIAKIKKAFKHSPLQITLALIMNTIHSVININSLLDVQYILQAAKDVKYLFA